MKVVGIGAGGHARVLIDALRLCGAEVVALTEANEALWNREIAGVRVAGGDDFWPKLLDAGVRHAFIALGSVDSSRARRTVYERAMSAGFEIVSVVHPRAVVASSARLGIGVQILAGSIVNADAIIGDNVIINTAAVVEHDCVIGNHAHIATGARLAGAVRVGEGAHIGIGAAVRQHITIGAEAIVGAGAAVVRDVPPGVTVVGVPARVRN